MNTLRRLYAPSLGLLTDLYQLTMAQGYWKLGMAEREAAFHLFFRRAPFGGSYAVACGLADAIAFLEGWGFDDADLAYLETIKGNDGEPLFHGGFLEALGAMRMRCDVDAVPEGTVVFPHAPMLRVTGPLLQAQIVETALLTLINFQTLIATKAARICRAARGEPVLEFGLRRAQGLDGAVSATRASYVGGCAGTSNVLAGRLLGVPVRGTHAHSWVMAFETELAAFRGYAEALPNNCVFLVDTYDTLRGVRNAVTVASELRVRGKRLVGVRLDSGDLVALSRGAREILDAGGFSEAAVVASNDLDEHEITKLEEAGARIDVWGVGTRLVTAHDQPALGGVYKLAALRDETSGAWSPRVKLSEQPVKVSNPGLQQVVRFERDGQYAADVICDLAEGDTPDLSNHARELGVDGATPSRPLLVPALRDGRAVAPDEPLDAVRARARVELDRLPEAVVRLQEPTPYPVGLSPKLTALKIRLIAEARKGRGGH